MTQTASPSCSPVSNGRDTSVGFGIGIGILLIALGCVTSLLFHEKRKHRKLRQDIQNSYQAARNDRMDPQMLPSNNLVERQMLPSNTIAEMQAKPQYHEIGSGQWTE